MTFNKYRSPSILKVLNLGLIVGFAVGLVNSVIHISDHQLFQYNLHNLIIFDIQSIVTHYVLIFVILMLGLVILHTTLKRILKKPDGSINDLETNMIDAVSVSLIIYVAIILICYSHYPQTIEFFKKFHLAEPLKVLYKSGIFKYLALSAFIVITACIFIYGFSIILLKMNIISHFKNSLTGFINSKLLGSLGIIILATVLIYNGVVYGYKKFNKPKGPNVLLISIDTLRADRMGAYGHFRDTTPNIDKIAHKGILFENAYSQAPWTRPSMSSMHTSYYPTQLQTLGLRSKINESFITLAEYLRNNFYNTSAVISNIVVSNIFGFDQGFEEFDQSPLRARDELTSQLVTDRALKYLEANKGDTFFLWLHYIDPHGNYIDHPDINFADGYNGRLGKSLHTRKLNKKKKSIDDEDLKYITDIYDEEIYYTDAQIGRVLDSLAGYGLEDNTIIIITADHGEEFMDRTRFGHNKTLYQELIHVPLIIYIPAKNDIKPMRSKSSVELRSIPRTIIDILGIKNTHFGGENLLIIAEEANTESYAFSQKPIRKIKDPRREAIMSGKWKLINNITINSYELYDLETDPGEKVNLFESEQVDENVKSKLVDLSSAIDKKGIVETVEVDLKQEDVRKLKALGYIE